MTPYTMNLQQTSVLRLNLTAHNDMYNSNELIEVHSTPNVPFGLLLRSQPVLVFGLNYRVEIDVLACRGAWSAHVRRELDVLDDQRPKYPLVELVLNGIGGLALAVRANLLSESNAQGEGCVRC